MKTDERYGPQFDKADGTIGETQLVRRWMVTDGKGNPFGPRQGRYTTATEGESLARCLSIRENNTPDMYPAGLTAEEFWCYPKHFDPVGSIKDHAEEILTELLTNRAA